MNMVRIILMFDFSFCYSFVKSLCAKVYKNT